MPVAAVIAVLRLFPAESAHRATIGVIVRPGSELASVEQMRHRFVVWVVGAALLVLVGAAGAVFAARAACNP